MNADLLSMKYFIGSIQWLLFFNNEKGKFKIFLFIKWEKVGNFKAWFLVDQDMPKIFLIHL